MKKKLSAEDRKAKWEAFLREQGPNPGTSFYGAWGWFSTMSSKFANQLRNEGFETAKKRSPR